MLFIESFLNITILTSYYQFVSKDHRWLFICGIGMTIFSLIYSVTYFTESPTFLVGKGRYDEAR